MDGGEDDARSFSLYWYCCISPQPRLTYVSLLLPKIVTCPSLPTAIWIQECRTGKYAGRWKVISRGVRTEHRFEIRVCLSSQYKIRSSPSFLPGLSVYLPCIHSFQSTVL